MASPYAWTIKLKDKVFGSIRSVLYVKVLPDIVINDASVPVTEYLSHLQYGFEYVKPPMAMFVFDLVGVSFSTVVFQAVSFGLVIVFASLSQP